VTAVVRPGAVRIALSLAGQQIARVRVSCERPRGVGAVLAGVALAGIPAAVGRLHAVCGVSQSVAAQAALAAAGAAVEPLDLRRAHQRLAGERLIEHLRATILSFADGVALTPAELAAVRTLLAAGAEGLAQGVVGPARLAALLGTLGLGTGGGPADGSWVARVLACAGRLPDCWRLAPADRLSADDDAAVIAALAHGGQSFAARPVLPGRCPETGAAARTPAVGQTSAGVARLVSRFDEIAEAARRLGDGSEGAEWVTAGTFGPGLGFAAVESPRGRLHHLVGIEGGAQLVRYLIVAPTEWNFAPAGPVARALDGLTLPEDVDPTVVAQRLAGLYDPCVACEVSVDRGGGDA